MISLQLKVINHLYLQNPNMNLNFVVNFYFKSTAIATTLIKHSLFKTISFQNQHLLMQRNLNRH